MKYSFLKNINKIRNFIFRISYKEFLIFVFFVFLSSIFWLENTLNEVYEADIVVPVELTGVPNNVVITTDIQDSLHVTIRDKGLAIWRYKRQKNRKSIIVDYSSHTVRNGKGTIVTSSLSKYIYPIFKSSQIVSIKPEYIDFYYSDGNYTTIPVNFAGNVTPSQMCYLSEVRFEPDSVKAIASTEILEQIKHATITPINIKNFSDTMVMKVALAPTKAVKFVPSEVTVTLYPDVYTEDEANIPITCLNLPADKRLITFPSKARVRYVVGLKNIRNVSLQDFSVEADYNELIKQSNSRHCRLVLKSFPQNVNSAKLINPDVEYLIESK